jgi:uncharacterized protein (DUF1778 family)
LVGWVSLHSTNQPTATGAILTPVSYNQSKSLIIPMNQPIENARVVARIPLAVKETLQKAADLSGATLNQFLVQAALKEADRVFETERTIVLSERDAQAVFDLLENPPTPNQQLLVAVDRHRAFIRENNRTAE